LERPERYRVQFTATEEYVHLVEEAKALLSHAVPNVSLEELQLRAMRALVTELNKRSTPRWTARPRERRSQPARGQARTAAARVSTCTTSKPPMPCRGPLRRTHREHTNTLVQGAEQPDPRPPRQRGRHIPAVVRRSVFERDGNRCSYVDANGTRCRETHRLEFHHLKPFAVGGDHHASNLTLRCSAHNALAAEEDFGRELIDAKKTSLEHERFGLSRG